MILWDNKCPLASNTNKTYSSIWDGPLCLLLSTDENLCIKIFSFLCIARKLRAELFCSTIVTNSLMSLIRQFLSFIQCLFNHIFIYPKSYGFFFFKLSVTFELLKTPSWKISLSFLFRIVGVLKIWWFDLSGPSKWCLLFRGSLPSGHPLFVHAWKVWGK